METFKAGVQYGDLKGTVAADRGDLVDASKWLQKNGHIEDGEHALGLSMYAGENHGTHRDPVNVTFLVSGLKGYENIPEMIQDSNDPIQVKKISVEMNLVDFFALFKRLEITLSSYGFLEGKTYTEG